MGREGVILLGLVSILALDQAAKTAVLRAGRVVRLGRFIRIRSVSGGSAMASAFGVRTSALWAVWLGIALLVLSAAPLTALFASATASVALGVALGGAASNLLDHVLRGAVVDYVDLRVWPVFNLADAAIVSGVLVAFVAR